jgi:hypothetical protein
MERFLAETHERAMGLVNLAFCRNGVIDNLFQSCSSWLEMIESVFEGQRVWHFLLLSPLFQISSSDITEEW